MLSWVKFVCLAFSRPSVAPTFLCCGPAKWASLPPLLPDRHLPLAPLPHLHVFFYILLIRRNLGVLTTWAVDPKLGITFTVDVPCYAWFRRARGPRNQKVAERGYLPIVHRCGIHVVLPTEPWITVAWVHLGTIACNLHIAWTTALFLHILLELGSSLASFSSIIPVFLASHCAFHASPSFDAAGKSLPRWRLALAQPSVGALRPFLAWHLCTSFS